jgi:hypothetical protein
VHRFTLTCTALRAISNARYWYQQARRPTATGDLTTESAAIAAALLASRRDSSAWR